MRKDPRNQREAQVWIVQRARNQRSKNNKCLWISCRRLGGLDTDRQRPCDANSQRFRNTVLIDVAAYHRALRKPREVSLIWSVNPEPFITVHYTPCNCTIVSRQIAFEWYLIVRWINWKSTRIFFQMTDTRNEDFCWNVCNVTNNQTEVWYTFQCLVRNLNVGREIVNVFINDIRYLAYFH